MVLSGSVVPRGRMAENSGDHSAREAVTEEDGNAWYDRRGYEADDKCAWSPTPFTDSSTGKNFDGTAFAYQYEWSNANSGCVKTKVATGISQVERVLKPGCGRVFCSVC
jgi:hypothetical protein